LKYIDDNGVDVYGIVNAVHDILGYPPFQPTNSTRKGAGIQGFKDDLIAALPVDDMKALVYKKMEANEFYKALVTAIQNHDFTVRIHCVKLSYVSCCFWYVQISVRIVVLTALLLPTDLCGHCANIAKMAGTARESTRKGS
jgi:hypothetical protein